MRNHVFVTAAAIIISMIGYSIIQYYANQDNIEVHNQVFNEFRELNRELNPILDQIPNATDAKVKQDKHYEIANIHFEELHNVSKVDLQNNELLIDINKTLHGLTNDIPSNLATTG